MPTFFFDVYDGRKAMRDAVGLELPNVAEAADEAAALLPEFAKETLPDRQSHGFVASVRDEAGEVVYRAMMLFQGQHVTDQNRPYVTTVTGVNFQMARRTELKAEARALSEKLAQNIEAMLTVIDDTRAQVEASRRAVQKWNEKDA
ncbi:DUF6894 family protein [Lichenibacterium dinghuense]|uniref:DUF6894 family protein n=1 Tax=Lichenibacterium dinghuense TaxID=2895977 RepID=UPI001F2920C6|nr:hypothetical protein [Lichenibacterium sp. 6Y81]